MKTIYFVACFALLAQLSKGQDVLLSLVEDNASTLTAAQKAQAVSLTRSPHYKSVRYVKTGRLLDSQKDGKLSFHIPGQSKTIEAFVSRLEAASTDDFTWSGNTKDGGSVILISRKGQLYGHIATYTEAYSLYSLGNGISALAEIDRASFKGSECGTPSLKTEIQPVRTADKGARLESCYSPIRVLVLSTQQARALDANIEQTIFTSIAQFNQALSNSNVTPNARMELAAYIPINFEEHENIQTDIELLANRPDVQQFRNDTRADVVVMLGWNSYTDVRGVVRQIDAAEPNAYAISSVGTSANNYTFAHEVGHLFGGAHENDNTGPLPYVHGKRFDVISFPFTHRYSTLLHTAPDGANWLRVLYYSNPNVNYDGVTTGDAAVADVARRINERALTVASFRPPTDAFYTRIDGPTSINYGQSVTYEAIYSCGPGPYSFEWSMSPNGFDSYVPIGNTEVLTTTALQYSTTYLRVMVTSGTGQQAYNYIAVQVDGGGAESRIAAPVAGIESAEGLEQVYPNPADQSTTINFALGESCPIKLEVVDMQGKSLKSVAEGYYQAGKHSKLLSTGDLPEGSYLCTLTAAGVVQSKRFIITRKSR